MISCEEFQPFTGRIEKIYNVDLFFGKESVIEYLLEQKIAEKVCSLLFINTPKTGRVTTHTKQFIPRSLASLNSHL